jgi:hypothetical protein
MRLPPIEGPPIRIEACHGLAVSRGKLRIDGRGTAVHAASFLFERRILLDRGLFQTPRELDRILAHELFHFVWRRLGNRTRREFEDILKIERAAGAGGEVGWSAERRKERLTDADATARSRAWRMYACESFCDTAGWLACGGRHQEFTLPPRFRNIRKQWFARLAGNLRA